jgi:hypothetical protein
MGNALVRRRLYFSGSRMESILPLHRPGLISLSKTVRRSEISTQRIQVCVEARSGSGCGLLWPGLVMAEGEEERERLRERREKEEGKRAA